LTCRSNGGGKCFARLRGCRRYIESGTVKRPDAIAAIGNADDRGVGAVVISRLRRQGTAQQQACQQEIIPEVDMEDWIQCPDRLFK